MFLYVDDVPAERLRLQDLGILATIPAERRATCFNGGSVFEHNEAFSFQIATEDQEETDRYWNAIVGNGGKESQCGWCKCKWGISWQITPRVLTDACGWQ